MRHSLKKTQNFVSGEGRGEKVGKLV